MGVELQVILVFGLFLVLLTSGMAVPVAIGVPAALFMYLHGGTEAFNGLGFIVWGSMNSFTLTAVPLFIFMAEILGVSGLSKRIYIGLSTLVAPLPGGLLQTNIAGCAIFASVSGSSVATAASLGRVSMPQLIARKYDMRLAAGSLAAGGTLGILIPPSIAMIIYASFTQTSVPKLFMAGVVPGVILTLMFMGYIAVQSMLRPGVAPREKGPTSLGDVVRALGQVSPFFILIAGTIGVLYAGIVTTTEAATIGCLLAAVLGFVFGELNWRGIVQALNQTIVFVGNILYLILAAFLFSAAVSFSGVSDLITTFVLSMELTRLEFFLWVFVLLTVLGCLIESLGLIVIVVPLLFPMLAHYNIDPILFGIIVVLFVELAQITPPMGINLFIIQSIWSGKLGDVIRGVVPFCAIILVMAFITITWPQIVFWLPNRMGG